MKVIGLGFFRQWGEDDVKPGYLMKYAEKTAEIAIAEKHSFKIWLATRCMAIKTQWIAI